MLKKVMIFCFTAVICFTIQVFLRGETLVCDFENGQPVTALGGSVYAVNDAGNQGDSVAVFSITNVPKGGAKGSNFFAELTGKVTTKFQYGFIGICLDITNMDIFDLTKYKGIKFSVKGDGNTYKIEIRSTVSLDYCYYTAAVPTTGNWTVLTLPFKDFRQESWGKQQPLKESLKNSIGFQWQTTSQPIPSVDLEIDDIYLY